MTDRPGPSFLTSSALNEAERLELLLAHRDRVRQQLAEVATHLEAIEYKIGLYERSTCTLT